jgi:hypothetical protein
VQRHATFGCNVLWFIYVHNSTAQSSCDTRITSNVSLNRCVGRAMAQTVSRRPLTAEAQVRCQVGQCGICGGQSGTGTGFSPSTSVFPSQFHSTGALLKKMEKQKKTSSSSSQGCTISLQCCGASVASAAGPFNNSSNNNNLCVRYQNRKAIHTDFSGMFKTTEHSACLAERFCHQIESKYLFPRDLRDVAYTLRASYFRSRHSSTLLLDLECPVYWESIYMHMK